MTRYVIDSNVAVKWTAPEEYWQQARRLLEDDDHDLIAPVTLLSEGLNALVQKFRKREIDSDVITEAYRTFAHSIGFFPLEPLCEPALALSLRLTISVHDAVFLVLALREGCQFVTAERRLVNAALQHFPETIVRLQDLPSF